MPFYEKHPILNYKMKKGTNMYTYNFQTSDPLTVAQLEWLNEQLHEYIPTENDFDDIPEWMTVIELQK